MPLMVTDKDIAYQKLHQAILNAIVTSNEIKDILLDFQENNLIEEETVLNLILHLEELQTMMKPVVVSEPVG